MQNKTKKLAVIVLLAMTAWQSFQFIRFLSAEITSVWTWIGKPEQWRSAAYTTSETFADFVVAANQVIPADSVIAIPSDDLASWQFSFEPYLEYLFFPREVVSCGSFTCLQQAATEGEYALIEDTNAFLASTDENLAEQIFSFNDRWAILTPENPTSTSGITLEPFDSIKQIMIEVAISVVWLSFIALPGYVMLSHALPDWRWLSRFFLGLTMGLGMLSFLLYLILLQTDTISRALILLAVVLWYGFSALVLYVMKRSGIDIRNSNLRPTIKPTLIEIIILICGAQVAFISLGKSYWGTDGIILWSLKGYAISEYGLAEGISNWGTLSARYPLQIPILISTFKTMFSDLVPQSKILPVVFYISLPMVVSEYFRLKYNWKQYIWFILLWLLSPQIIWHGTIGYANLPLTYYLVAAVAIALTSFKQPVQNSTRTCLLAFSGTLFVLSAWTRPEAAALVTVILLLILVWQKKLTTTWMLYLPFIIYSIIWAITKDLVYLTEPFTDGFLTDGLLNVLKGNIIWEDVGYLVKAFFEATLDPGEWGLIGWLILLGLITIPVFKLSNPETNLLLGNGILLTLAAAAVIYLRTYNPAGCDVSCMVSIAMERLILPGITLLWLGSSDYILSKLGWSKEAV